MEYTLRDKGLKEILLAVDVGYDLDLVAQEYVKAFNQSGKFRIVQWKVREPKQDQIADIKSFNQHIKLEWVKDHWESVYVELNGKEVRKRLFLLQLVKIIEDTIGNKPMFDAADAAVKALKENFNRNVKREDDDKS